MIPRSSTFKLLLAAALILGAAAPVSAFERQSVEGAPELELYWERRGLDIFVGYDTANEASPAGIQQAAMLSFQTWQSAGGCTDIMLRDVGPPGSLMTNLDGGDFDGQNKIVFRQAWPASASPTALALTTVVYERRTGAIQDADIDLNDASFFWTTGLDASTVNDVENTLTHELGHFLGLAHVADPDATMYADSPEGEIEKRTLGTDDIDGVCFVYPAGAPTPGVTVSGTGISRGALTSATSCSASPGKSDDAAWWLAILGVLFVRRATRRQR